MVHALHKLVPNPNGAKLCAMSGGNFARSFCYVSQLRNAVATVVMPQTVPKDRIEICKQYGANVILAAPNQMVSTIEELKSSQGYVFFHTKVIVLIQNQPFINNKKQLFFLKNDFYSRF